MPQQMPQQPMPQQQMQPQQMPQQQMPMQTCHGRNTVLLVFSTGKLRRKEGSITPLNSWL